MLDLHSQQYRDYMKSPRWDAKKLQRLKIDNFSCCMCGKSVQYGGLEVHHITYKRPTNENVMQDLCTLCHDCHTKMHRFWDRPGGYKIYVGTRSGDD